MKYTENLELGLPEKSENVSIDVINENNTKIDSALPFKFGVDADGNYGYYKDGADSVTPFKNPQGTLEISENGSYNIADYATAEVSVSGGEELPAELLEITGNCTHRFYNNGWNTFINTFGKKITTHDITNPEQMFAYSNLLEEIPFSINGSSSSSANWSYCFSNCSKLKKIPVLNIYPSAMNNIFSNCYSLTELPNNLAETINWNLLHKSSSDLSYIFINCYSLRHIPQSFIDNLWSVQTNYNKHPTYGCFTSCYVIDEIVNFPIVKGTVTSGAYLFSSFVTSCNRLKRLTFALNEDGTPQIANFRGATLDLSQYVGYANSKTNITGYSYAHGITSNTQVTNDDNYQLLKDNPDWWTINVNYSRYNHDSAVETINSLPDTSAYGTNTIKFKGQAGTLTDGGAISNLTEEEIAVATAKGWTVTIV